MKYAQAKHILKSGDVLAWRGTGPLSRFIAHVTGGAYTHVGVVWCFDDRIFILQDKEFVGIDLIAASEAKYPCDWIQTNLNWTDETRKLAIRYLGKPYDYLAAIQVGLNMTPLPHKQICSIYVGELVTQMGVPCPLKGLTPEALVNILLGNGGVMKRLNSNSFE